jgi:hypothetical protein
MVVIHRRLPDVKLDQTQAGLIQAKLLSVVDVKLLGEAPPQFLYSKFAQGVFRITCANEPSKVWLMQTISGLGELWEGAEVTVVESKDLLKRPRVLVHIPDTSEVTTVIKCLGIQNPELKMRDWSVMSHKVTEKEQTLAFSIDPDSFKDLTHSNFKAFWGMGRVIFWSLKDEQQTQRLRVLQVNLHHSRAASAALCVTMRNCDVALIQEPWTYMGEIKGLKEVGGGLIYSRSTQNPRTCI